MGLKLTEPGLLSPRQVELGYSVYQDGYMFYLYYRDELVTFCLATAIPGVLREVAFRDSFWRNVQRLREEGKL